MPQYLFYKKKKIDVTVSLLIKKTYKNIALLKGFVTNLLCLT